MLAALISVTDASCFKREQTIFSGVELVFCTALQCSPLHPQGSQCKMDASSVGYAPLLFLCCWHKSRLKSPSPVVQSPQDHHKFQAEKWHFPSHWWMNSVQSEHETLKLKRSSHILLLWMHLVYSMCQSTTPRIWAMLTKAMQQSLVIHTKIAQHFKECTM